MAHSLPFSHVSPTTTLCTKYSLNNHLTQIINTTHLKIKPRNLHFRREKIPPIILNSAEKSKPLNFHWGIFTNMWWAKLKGAIGQRFNLEGIISSSKVLTNDPHLLLPHLRISNIGYINWEELHRRGFKAVVFDKDNTITLPYSLNLWDPLKGSMESCKAVFGEGKVAILSNSVGLYEFDPDYSGAEAVERELGIAVVRHKVKKPGGGSEEIERLFGCKSVEVVMVGDRRFTDIVFGNRNGFFTVLTEPLTGDGENFVVKMVRKMEELVVSNWFRRALKAKSHCFLANDEVDLVRLDEPL
ncbi:phosphatidylglycerophosphatase GEP4, mitochondrial-like [Chenopodium quinoa]|nr:phosphatidylglycerophosphatase GEP4, mitochondrial-like [Chenopodium quinoa]